MTRHAAQPLRVPLVKLDAVIVIVRTSGGPKALEPSCSRAKRVPEVDSSCRLLMVPLFPGSSSLTA